MQDSRRPEPFNTQIIPSPHYQLGNKLLKPGQQVNITNPPTREEFIEFIYKFRVFLQAGRRLPELSYGSYIEDQFCDQAWRIAALIKDHSGSVDTQFIYFELFNCKGLEWLVLLGKLGVEVGSPVGLLLQLQSSKQEGVSYRFPLLAVDRYNTTALAKEGEKQLEAIRRYPSLINEKSKELDPSKNKFLNPLEREKVSLGAPPTEGEFEQLVDMMASCLRGENNKLPRGSCGQDIYDIFCDKYVEITELAENSGWGYVNLLVSDKEKYLTWRIVISKLDNEKNINDPIATLALCASYANGENSVFYMNHLITIKDYKATRLGEQGAAVLEQRRAVPEDPTPAHEMLVEADDQSTKESAVNHWER